ncbi:MAG: SPASM domain-containing protein [Thiolinea sp.]
MGKLSSVLNWLPSRFKAIETGHFEALTDPQQARALFQRSVNMVELEVFSYCNRVCWFCPNSFIDRRSANYYMDEDLYLGILDQLASIDYAGKISWSRYNEPLADRIILERIRQARERLPHAVLHTNTNGDYLKPDYLAELRQAGLNSLNIQVYLANDERYEHEQMKAVMRKVQQRLGLSGRLVKEKKGEWLEARLDYPGMQIRQYARNFEVNGCSRGDTLPIFQDYVRDSPCFSPFEHLYIDYNGRVMPCCNLRSDVPEHQKAVVGDLREQPDIFQVYAGAALSRWRAALVDFSPKQGLCRNCRFNVVKPTVLNLQMSARAAKLRKRGES